NRPAHAAQPILDGPPSEPIDDVDNGGGVSIETAITLLEDRGDQIRSDPGLDKLLIEEEPDVGFPNLFPKAGISLGFEDSHVGIGDEHGFSIDSDIKSVHVARGT